MKDKELIELIKFTAFEMLMPQKISDEDAKSILKDYKEAINYSQCCKSDSEQLKCNHTWIVNHHQGTRYCSKGCDNFEKHTF